MNAITLTLEQEEEYRNIIQALLDKKLDPIETAREFGVDIEQLRLLRKRKPLQRLRRLQGVANRALSIFKLSKEYLDEFAVEDFMIGPLTLENLIKIKEASPYPLAKRQVNILKMLQKEQGRNL